MIEFTVTSQFRAVLGEGLHWDAVRSRLWFVDIHGQRIACWRPGDERWQEWATPQRVGWVIPLYGSEALLAGFQQGVARVRLGEQLTFDWVCHAFAGAPHLRLNDAKADSSGAVWAGSMNNDDDSRADGRLFRIDAATAAMAAVDTGYRVANGPAIHPNGRLLLHTDSALRIIYAFDLDVATGRLANRRVWKRFDGAEGYPDGMTFDADGCLWVAHWGAGCISRFTPGGALLRRVKLPASHISNVCFGGTALDRLFVTSARAGLSPAQHAAEPLAGAMFEVDAQGVKGLAGRPAKG